MAVDLLDRPTPPGSRVMRPDLGAAPALGGGAAPEAAPAAAQGAISFRDVGKVYISPAGEVGALKGVDVEVPAGGIFGVIGRSGAGKSSLLRLVNRLERPTSGEVLIDCEDVGRLDKNGLVALRRRVGMIFQHFNLLSAKTVAENVALPLVVAKRPKAEIASRVAKALELVGMSDKRDVRPGRLSGGQKQRVGIARALVGGPKILLCDEATSALDPETTRSILHLLKDVNRRFGVTVMLITHEMSVIREICDRVVVLEKGEVAEEGPVWRVFGEPRHSATRALLAPLARGLPTDVAARLLPAPPRSGGSAIVEIAFRDGASPDLAVIAAGLGGRPRVLIADVDRIGGRSQGRVVAELPLEAGRRLDLAGLPFQAKALGYVAADD